MVDVSEFKTGESNFAHQHLGMMPKSIVTLCFLFTFDLVTLIYDS